MSKLKSEKGDLPAGPSAPPSDDYDAASAHFAPHAPPPSYEESQRMCSNLPHAHSQLQQQQFPPYTQLGSIYHPVPNMQYGPSASYQWAAPMQPQHYFQPGFLASPSPQGNAKESSNPKVLTFAKGAKIRTTPTGAVTIPPPPPGYAPTPAQYAAMQGQQVLVKKEKKSFF